MKESFVQIQGQVPQGGTTLAPMGRPASGWPSFGFGLDALQLRAAQVKASCLSILHSEAFSIAIGFVMSILVFATLWAFLWIVSIMMGG